MLAKEKLSLTVASYQEKLKRGDLITPVIYVELAIGLMCTSNNCE